MSFTDKMEKKVFFKIVRLFAFIISFIGFIGIIIGAVLFVQNFSNIFPSTKVKVEYSDVQSAVQADEDTKKAKKEAAEVEKYNNMAVRALRQAYETAYSFFSNEPEGSVLSVEGLRSRRRTMEGISESTVMQESAIEAEMPMLSSNIEFSVPGGNSSSLQITAKHKKGNKIYSVDATGNISEVLTDTTQAAPETDQAPLTQAAKDNATYQLINEIVNEFPKDRYNYQKVRDGIQGVTNEIPEDYQIKFLEDVKEVVKKAPADKKAEYFYQFTDIYDKKLREMSTNKELKKAEATMKFAIYGGTILGGILIIALFGLILVLLAIERNTRKSEGVE